MGTSVTMTNGEVGFRKALTNSLREGEHLDEIDSIVDHVVTTLKEGKYFIHEGKIRTLDVAEWMDYEDDYTNYSVWVEAV